MNVWHFECVSFSSRNQYSESHAGYLKEIVNNEEAIDQMRTATSSMFVKSAAHMSVERP
jgi:hypothetical protein